MKKILLEGKGVGKVSSEDGSASFSFDMSWDREKNSWQVLMDFLLLGEGRISFDYKDMRRVQTKLEGVFKKESLRLNSKILEKEIRDFATSFARFLDYYEHYLMAYTSSTLSKSRAITPIPWIWTGKDLEFMIMRTQRRLKVTFSDYDLEKFRGLKLEWFLVEKALFSLYFKF